MLTKYNIINYNNKKVFQQASDNSETFFVTSLFKYTVISGERIIT